MKFLKYYFNNKKLIIFNFILAPLSAFFNVFFIFFLIKISDNFTSFENISDKKFLLFLLGFIGCGIGIALLNYFYQRLNVYIIYEGHQKLRNKFFNLISESHPRSIKKINKNNLLNLLEKEGNFIGQSFILVSNFVSSFLALLGFSIMYSLEGSGIWKIILIYYGALFLNLILSFVFQLFASLIYPKKLELNSVFLKKINSILETINIFLYSNKILFFLKKSDKSLDEFFKKFFNLSHKENLLNFVSNLIYSLIFVGIIAISFYFLKNKIITLTIFLLTFTVFPLISSYFSSFFQGIPFLFQIIKVISNVKKELNFLEKKDVLPQEKFEKLEIKNLNYQIQEKQVFKNFNLEIFQNQKILVQGPSGCGKTTLVDIILNINNNYQGKILFNNKEYFDKLSLEKNIGLCNNELEIINTKSLENAITLDQEKNWTKITYLQEMFNIDFEVTDTKNLSVGQKQRLVLASVFYLDHNLIILDEALSNLDKKNQSDILKKLLNLKDKTLIIISHHINKKYHKNFDQIINLSI